MKLRQEKPCWASMPNEVRNEKRVRFILVPKYLYLISCILKKLKVQMVICISCVYGKYRVMFSNNFLSLSQLIFWKWVYKISSFSRFVCFKKFVTLNILVTYDLHLVCFCLRKPLIQIFWFKIIIPCNLDLRKLKFYLQRRYLQLFYHKFIG